MNDTFQEVIIDVREPDEYKAEHVEHSINIPLSQFPSQAPGILAHFLDRRVIIMCRSGKRAQMAQTEALRLGFEPAGGFSVYQGGILAWKAAGKSTAATGKSRLSILRQTHLAAGLLGLSGVILGFAAHPGFFLVSAFVSTGLTFAGLSGICMMSHLLARMPWNRDVPNLKQEVCIANTGEESCS